MMFLHCVRDVREMHQAGLDPVFPVRGADPTGTWGDNIRFCPILSSRWREYTPQNLAICNGIRQVKVSFEFIVVPCHI